MDKIIFQLTQILGAIPAGAEAIALVIEMLSKVRDGEHDPDYYIDRFSRVPSAREQLAALEEEIEDEEFQ